MLVYVAPLRDFFSLHYESPVSRNGIEVNSTGHASRVVIMSHNHSHRGHGHDHGGGNYNRAFVISVALNTGFVIIEVVYGMFANSLALLADAGHNLSDVLGLLLACSGDAFLVRVAQALHDRFSIEHTTLQVETGDPSYPCSLAGGNLV